MDKKDDRIRLFLTKSNRYWKEQQIIKKGKNVAYIGTPDKSSREFYLVSSKNENVARLEFYMKTLCGGFIDPVKAVIHVFEPNFAFELNLSEKGMVYNVEDFSVICTKPNHYTVVDGNVTAIELGPCAGSVEAYCAHEKYEFLAVALMIGVQAYRNKTF